MMVARPLLLLAAYLIFVCGICGETLLPLDAEGGVGSIALGARAWAPAPTDSFGSRGCGSLLY